MRVKRKLQMRRRKVCQNSWSRRTDRKLFSQTTRWYLGEHVKIYHGITALQHLIDPRRLVSLKEPFDELWKVLQQLLPQSGLDERWWFDSMECYCSLRNVQDFLAERRFGEPFKGPTIPTGAMVEYHPTSPKDQARIHHFGTKVLPGFLLGYELIAGEVWKVDLLIAGLEDLEMLDASTRKKY